MPMYTAFAPFSSACSALSGNFSHCKHSNFLEGDKGDRRVTGRLHVAKGLENTIEGSPKQCERYRILVEFSREFGSKVPL